MTIEELNRAIEKIKSENPNSNVDKMEIGPLFNGDVVMMIADLTIIKNGGWDDKDAQVKTSVHSTNFFFNNSHGGVS